MRTLEKRQPRRWLAAFHDPYRKLAAIVLAIGLWFLINLQIEGSKTLTMRLVVVDPQRLTPRPNAPHQVSVELPLDLVVGRRFFNADKVIETVDVKISGPRGRIDAIVKEQIELQVKNLVTNERTKSDAASQGFVEFTKADIQETNQLRDLRIDLDPPRIRLEVESIKNFPVQLSPSVIDLHVDDPDLMKRLRLDTATFSHQTAVILGPASELEKFNRAPGAKLLHTWLKGAASERQITTVVDLAPEHKEAGLRLEETPSMTIPLLPYTEMFELEVPIFIDDLALPVALRGKYRPDHEARTKTVRIRAGGRLLSHLTAMRDGPDKNQLRVWALANLRLNLWVAPPEPDAPPQAEILCTAVLALQGALRSSVERNECELAQAELFTLRRVP